MLSRRRMLSRLGWTAASGTLASRLPASATEPEATKPGAEPRTLNVQDFGAAGDGMKDNTRAFTAALKAAAETGNSAVFVPRGLTIFYPEQKMTKSPVPYPWTIRGQGDNISLIDLFLANPYQAGPGNCLLTQCGSDIGPTAVLVENVQSHAGVSFVNCQFMAGIEVAATNKRPVKFTACGFWGVPTTEHHARLEGKGHTTFSGCHFTGWGQRDKAAPAIHALTGGLTVTGCDFMDRGKAQLKLEAGLDAAVVFGNRLREKEKITNLAGSCAQIGMNVVSCQ